MATACNDRYCGETGHSLLITRYVPVPETVKSHPVPARLLANMPKLAPSLKYALTLLRSGYLYVFNETSKTWDGYFVPAQPESDAFSYRSFHRFLAKKTQAYVNVQKNLDKHSAQKFDFKEKNGCDCKHPKSEESILVEGSLNKQTNIYFIFSDVEWTANNFKNIAENKNKYMQKVDLKNFIAKKCRDFQDYIMIDTELLDMNSYAVNYTSDLEGYDAESEDTPGEHEPIAINTDGEISGAACLIDPVGILEELTNIAQRGHKSFSDSTFMKANAYQYWMKDTLDNLEFGIKADSAQRLFKEHYFELAISQLGMPRTMDSIFLPGKRPAPLQRPEADLEMLHAKAAEMATEKALAKAGDDAWKKYKNCFKKPSYDGFNTQLGIAAKAHSDKHVEPAAKSIVTWLKFDRTTDYFDICFDKDDTEHSTVFPEVFLKCTQSTGEFGTCNNLFYQWLTDNTDNLLIRALYVNNPQVKSLVEKHNSHFTKAGTEFLKGVDWRALFKDYNKIFSPKQLEVIDSFTSQITANLSASLIELNAKLSVSNIGNKAFFLTALQAGEIFTLQKINLADREASINAFLEKTFDVQNLKKAINGKNPTSDRTKQSILDNYRALKARLFKLAAEFHQKNGHSGYFFVNAADVAPGDGYAKKLGKGSLVLSEREVMNLAAVSETKGAAYKRMNASVLSGILFAVSMLGWFSKEVKPEQTTTAYTQLFSLVLGFSGEVMERVSGRQLAVAAGAETLSNRAKGLTPRQFTRHTRINAAGRLFGGAAALILGVLDIISAVKLAKKEGGSTLVYFLVLSGGLSLTLGLAIVVTSAPAMFAMFPTFGRMAATIMPRAPYIGAAILILAILIALFTDNELEAWIKDTIWGTNKKPEYLNDFNGAQKALSKIIGKPEPKESI